MVLTKRPWQDVRDGWEDAAGSEEHACVACADRFCSREHHVADATHGGEENDHESSLLGAVRDPGG